MRFSFWWCFRCCRKFILRYVGTFCRCTRNVLTLPTYLAMFVICVFFIIVIIIIIIIIIFIISFLNRFQEVVFFWDERLQCSWCKNTYENEIRPVRRFSSLFANAKLHINRSLRFWCAFFRLFYRYLGIRRGMYFEIVPSIKCLSK